jgi:hypothetical protein
MSDSPESGEYRYVTPLGLIRVDHPVAGWPAERVIAKHRREIVTDFISGESRDACSCGWESEAPSQVDLQHDDAAWREHAAWKPAAPDDTPGTVVPDDARPQPVNVAIGFDETPPPPPPKVIRTVENIRAFRDVAVGFDETPPPTAEALARDRDALAGQVNQVSRSYERERDRADRFRAELVTLHAELKRALAANHGQAVELGRLRDERDGFRDSALMYAAQVEDRQDPDWCRRNAAPSGTRRLHVDARLRRGRTGAGGDGAMTRRLCQYCTRPLGRFAKLLGHWTCDGCVSRMQMGGSPMRPPAKEKP